MLDITLRPAKDAIFDPICALVPSFVSPLFITFAGFLSGLAACYNASQANVAFSVYLWLLNRALDCIDGALARRRKQESDLGGFLDLLCDFVVYSLIPISCALGNLSTWKEFSPPPKLRGTSFWLSLAAVESSFHINNFVLFFIAAILEKKKADSADGNAARDVKELTSVAMRPALVEGFESGLIFTLMLSCPEYVETLNWIMALLVTFGVLQRAYWVVMALKKEIYSPAKTK